MGLRILCLGHRAPLAEQSIEIDCICRQRVVREHHHLLQHRHFNVVLGQLLAVARC